MTADKDFILKETEATTSENQENPKREENVIPEMTFSLFVFSLNSSALLHLGLIEHPETKKAEKNLPLAKQTIDILGLLAEKTKGNLAPEEENLLQHVLHDLRLLFVQAK